jgi:hypothetical protein
LALDCSREGRNASYKYIHIEIVGEDFLYVAGTRNLDSKNGNCTLSCIDRVHTGTTTSNGNHPIDAMIVPIGVIGAIVIVAFAIVLRKNESQKSNCICLDQIYSVLSKWH